MKPLVKHPGGKRRIAERIYTELGCPAELCEPFAGGLAVSLVNGARPKVLGEAIPVLRTLYRTLASHSWALWAELDALPKTIVSEEAYYAQRRLFNARQTPGRYVLLNYACFNGLARFNRAGGFNSPMGKPLPRSVPQFDAMQRTAYAGLFRGVEVHEDWGPAVLAAKVQGLPVYADPPYVDTFAYGATKWGVADLLELAHALPRGALLSERMGMSGVLAAAGYELRFEWTARNSVSRGTRTKRPEGVWRKL